MSADPLKSGDLFADVPARLEKEEMAVLAELPGARIERIVSTGQASPQGFWYDQDWTEWVVVLSGSAGLRIEGEDAPRILAPGDYLQIPPHVRHRVDWTDADEPTVWLAVHTRLGRIRMSVSSRAVLGIDAAWTREQPSGVAAAVEMDGLWTLAAVEASYEHFAARAEGKPSSEERPRGSLPVAAALLEAGRKICERPIDLVAVDMPLAYSKMTKRRCSDTEVSTRYGDKHASTHSPSADRPGKISDLLRRTFEEAGYPLRIKDGSDKPPTRRLIEVYPHPALIEFLGSSRRLQYKASKALRYWPKLFPTERRAELFIVWRSVVKDLDRRISGAAAALPPPDADHKGWRLKAYEDKLDAVACAAVAIAGLDGTATAFADADSAI